MLKLKHSKSKIGKIHAAGPTAKALWASAATGLTDRKLNKVRLAAAMAEGSIGKGQSVHPSLKAWGIPEYQDPGARHHRAVFKTWAAVIWNQQLKQSVINMALDGARKQLNQAANPWQVAKGPAAAFLLSCQRIRWRVKDAQRLTTDLGEELDLLQWPP